MQNAPFRIYHSDYHSLRAVEKGLISKEEATSKLQKLQSIGRYNKAIIEDAAKQIEGCV